MSSIKRTFGFILNHPIGKRHPLKALLRFVRWQLQCRLRPGKLIIKPFIGNVKFYARKGLTGITGNIYTGLHEFSDMGFLLHLLTPEDTFIDAGANAGSYTLLAAGVRGASSIAIEPVPATFSILSANISLNNLEGSVTPMNAGAGAVKGTLKFSAHEDTTNHVLADNETSATAISVPIITIDSLGVKPTLIKIDVEGFETEVLRGMSATLDDATLKAIIIELNGSGGRYGFNERDIHDLLLSKGFLPFIYNPIGRKLTRVETFGSHNTIYCRDLEFINARVSKAESFKIMGESF